MPKIALVYGLRYVPLEDVEAVEEARIRLTGGRDCSVSMHVLEGTLEEIRRQLEASVSVFFEASPPDFKLLA
jgi:hypothetical protein